MERGQDILLPSLYICFNIWTRLGMACWLTNSHPQAVLPLPSPAKYKVLIDYRFRHLTNLNKDDLWLPRLASHAFFLPTSSTREHVWCSSWKSSMNVFHLFKGPNENNKIISDEFCKLLQIKFRIQIDHNRSWRRENSKARVMWFKDTYRHSLGT